MDPASNPFAPRQPDFYGTNPFAKVNVQEPILMTSLPATQNPFNLPQQSGLPYQNVPLQGQNIPLQGQNIQLQGQNIPLQGQNIPLQGQNIPLQGQNIQLQGQNIQLQGQNIPLQGQNIPLQGQNIQFQAQNIQLQTQNIQLQGQNIPLQAQNITLQAQNIPLQGQGIPIQGQNITLQAQQIPLQTVPIQGQVPTGLPVQPGTVQMVDPFAPLQALQTQVVSQPPLVEQTISTSLPVGALNTTTVSTTVLPATPAQWLWMNDSNGWSPYDPAQSLVIENAFMTGDTTVPLTMGIFANKSYIIHFPTMTQQRLDKKAIRQVLRKGGPLPPNYWEYDEGGVWKPFDIETSQYLDRSIMGGYATVRLCTGFFIGKNYIADLKNFLQVNLTTNSSRRIRKLGFSPTFSTNAARVDSPPLPDHTGEWEWLNDQNVWVSYDKETQTIINGAFAKSKKKVTLKHGWYGRHGGYEIHLKNMTQKSLANRKKRTIQRREVLQLQYTTTVTQTTQTTQTQI